MAAWAATTPQTIAFDAPADHTYGDIFPLDASASSGLPVTFTITGPASLNGNIVTCTGGGPVTVTASQAGDATYLPATPVSYSFLSKFYLSYNFNDGTTQGWITQSSSTTAAGYNYNLAFAPVTTEQQWNVNTYNPGLGAYFLGESPVGNDWISMTWTNWPAKNSGVHQTLWIHSPPFVLNGCGDLTYQAAGCEGAINPATNLRNITLINKPVPVIAATWGAESGNPGKELGVIAIGLRRDDGTFVLSRSFYGHNGESWDTYTFSASELAPFVHDGHTYTLDMIDALAGTYAWCAMDNVKIPGELPRPGLNIAFSSDKTKLVLTWTPTTDGQSTNATSTVLSSPSLTAPANTWTTVATLRTQNGSTSIQLPLPATQTFYRIKLMAPNWDVSTVSAFVNPGVYSTTNSGNLYEWIPTQDVGFQIADGGLVKIIAPLTKKSSDGSHDCNRFIYDHTHTRLTPSDQAALFGSGLKLAPGNYGFAILWINASTYDQVFADPWTLTDNPDTFPSNSAQVDYFNLSIIPIAPTNNTAGSIREVVLPYDLQRVSWLPHYQVLPYDLNLPSDKGFGITRMLMDIPLDQVYKKVTHINHIYGFLGGVPASKKWATMQAYNNNGVVTSNEWLIANATIDKDFITFAEMDENFGNANPYIPNHAQRAQQVFEGIYNRMKSELGVTSPNQTRLYDDYFSAMSGYDNGANFAFGINITDLTTAFSSMAAARGNCAYFIPNGLTPDAAYTFRNWFQGGYLDSYAHTPEGIRIYNEIYNFEKRFLAAPDRKVAKFGWSDAEGVNSNMYRSGTKTRLHFSNGDIIRPDVVAWPFHMMLNESFWTLLLGNDYVLWHSSVPLVTDIRAWGDSWAAGAGAGSSKWQSTGGGIVNYDPNNLSQPQRVSNAKGIFPNNPHMGESGGFAGAWLVSQLTTASDRISKTVEYCPFSYKINGGSVQTGYYDSNIPKNGSLGNAKLSRYGVANYGQANIVRTYDAKKPICIYTEGVNGGAVIYHNVYCGLTDVNEVTITTKLGDKTFTVIGNSLHVFYVTSAP